jgi:hypothetical protein
MKRRILTCATVSGLVLSIGLAVAPVSAGPPTEMDVSPYTRDLIGCIVPGVQRAYWTVSLWGGTSGNFSVTVHYGDGTYNTSSHATSYDTHHDFGCSQGGLRQDWQASRGGGGTAYDTTYVLTH